MSLVWITILICSFAIFHNFLKKKKKNNNNNNKSTEDQEKDTPNPTNFVTDSEVPEQQQQEQDILQNLPPGQDYEVFLSCRGKDTRKGFTDHLYRSLLDAGIWVFRDDDELPVGEIVGPQLLEAIKRSKISIPILSEDYASSKGCLQELVQILECRKTSKQVVLPIFYGVEPGNVRHMSGSFGEAVAAHERKHAEKVVEEWKEALRGVGSLKGWESGKFANGHEVELVKKVVKKVLTELKKAFLNVTENLVGVSDHVVRIMKVLDPKSNGTRVVAIYGLAGVGKTTLAKLMYNNLSSHYEHCCFLANIRETSSQHKGMEYLQKQLISNILNREYQDLSHVDEGTNIIKNRFKGKRVLILLDDVDDRTQLKVLAGQRDWFGQGSRIIITTRYKEVVDSFDLDCAYELEELDVHYSLQLFSKHAFRRDSPPHEFKYLAGDVVRTTGGLPLALEIIGSFLFSKRKAVWKDTIKKLSKIPHNKVREKLRTSYEALEHEEKQIFLDIACMLIRTNKKIAIYMWDDCDFFPHSGIEVLILMSFIKIGDNKELWMHDQLRDLGREIVRQENYYEPGKRSRLWISKEALEVVEEMQGSKKIQALCLNCNDKSLNYCFASNQFKNLTRLRFLQVNHANLSGDFHHLFSELRWLEWHGCPSNFLPTNFCPMNLVVLNLSGSNITGNWNGWSQIEMTKKLKVLNLSWCSHLITTPVFSAFKELEILILESCARLEHIDSSIGDIKALVTLNLRYCKKLKELPAEVGKLQELRNLLVDGTSIHQIPIARGCMKKLKTLSLTGCPSLAKVPSSIGYLGFLSTLNLRDCANLPELPDSIGSLVRLHHLLLGGCKSLRKLPESIGKLESLVELNLSETSIVELPESVGNLQNLKLLRMIRCCISNLPRAVGSLRKLEEIDASDCISLQGEIPEEYGGLSSLTFLRLNNTSISGLPGSISKLFSLKRLELWNCKSLRSLREVPPGLTSLEFHGTSMDAFPNTSNLSNLTKLEFSDFLAKEKTTLDSGKLIQLETLIITNSNVLPNDWRTLSQLKWLTLINVSISYLPSEIRALANLEQLNISHCQQLEHILELPSSLVKVGLDECPKLKTLPALSNLKYLFELMISNCSDLTAVEGLEGLESLAMLTVVGCRKLFKLDGIENLEYLSFLSVGDCEKLEKLPDLSNLKNLNMLNVCNCKNLVEIKSMDNMDYLQRLNIQECTSIQALPDLTDLNMLKELEIGNCKKLHDVEGLDKLTSLEKLYLGYCEALEKLPNLSNLKNLATFSATECKNLVEIQGLNGIECLNGLYISGCTSLEQIGDISGLKGLRMLKLEICVKLRAIEGIEKLTSLDRLFLSGCKSMGKFPDLSKLRNLEELHVQDFNELVEIPGLKELKSLRQLIISGCNSLEDLPDFSIFTALQYLEVKDCEKLKELRGLKNLESLCQMEKSGCKLIVEYPHVSKLKNLENLKV